MAFAFSFLNGQLPAHEEAVPHLCVHTYIYMCVHMQADVFEALDLASEFDKVGRGKFKNSQGLCHHGLYIACALSFALTRHDGVLVPENGMEDPGFGRPFGIPGHDQVFLQAADGCVPCCRDHMDEAPGHPGAGAANEPGSQIVLAETMQQVSTAQLDGSTTMPRSRDTATVSFVC